MREKKWTPGPWEMNAWKLYRTYSLRHDGTPMLELGERCGSNHLDDEPEWEANAKLMLAAPDLVEALENLIEYPQCLELPESARSEELKRAIAALAKAYGEEEP